MLLGPKEKHGKCCHLLDEGRTNVSDFSGNCFLITKSVQGEFRCKTKSNMYVGIHTRKECSKKEVKC